MQLIVVTCNLKKSFFNICDKKVISLLVTQYIFKENNKMSEKEKKNYKITIKYNEDKQQTCEKILDLMLRFIVESNILDKTNHQSND